MIEKIIGKISLEDMLLGTCFIVNESYVFTARHVLENKELKNDVLIKRVNCKFENIKQNSEAELVYEDLENDFAILKLINKIETDFYKISREVIEEDDKFKSAGYSWGDSNISIFSGYVSHIKEKNRFEICINNEKENADWKGVSGAPIVIENNIYGVIVEQECGGNLKTKLEFIGINNILNKLIKKDPDLIKYINIGYHPYLQERLSNLSEDCKNLFLVYKKNKLNFIVHYHIFKENTKSIEKLKEILRDYIHDYGVELLLDEQLDSSNRRREKREIERKIQKRKDKIIELIKEENQLIHILLWILIEGELCFPRIGSYIIDFEKNIPRDLYINGEDNNFNIIISNGYLDESIINNFKICIDEIESYLNGCNEKDYIFIPDKLIIESLDLIKQEKINKYMFGKEKNNEVEVSIIILIGFNYRDIFNSEIEENYKVKYLEKYIEKYEDKFIDIINKSKIVNKMKLEWIFLPFDNVENFNTYINY